MQDIREYSSQELSLIVNNEEGLYKEFMRACNRGTYKGERAFKEFMETCIDEFIIYDKEQEAELLSDFENEVAELNKEEEEA